MAKHLFAKSLIQNIVRANAMSNQNIPSTAKKKFALFAQNNSQLQLKILIKNIAQGIALVKPKPSIIVIKSVLYVENILSLRLLNHIKYIARVPVVLKVIPPQELKKIVLFVEISFK